MLRVLAYKYVSEGNRKGGMKEGEGESEREREREEGEGEGEGETTA